MEYYAIELSAEGSVRNYTADESFEMMSAAPYIRMKIWRQEPGGGGGEGKRTPWPRTVQKEAAGG